MFIVFISMNAMGQRLSGIVIDNSSKEQLSNVAVYFPEVHRGTVTAHDGTFSLTNLPKGMLLLQASHVGYENFFASLKISNDSTLTITLTPSLIEMKEMVITGAQTQSPNETSFNVVQLSQHEITQRGSLSVSDAIARLPGISQLTTGAGISKPVIRGLYGNRIQVNVNGIRFDNQQWQDEHGLGLSDMGVARIEIIRGPASVLYGSDAMGGVLNVIEEKPASIGEFQQDVNARIFSNTYGLSLNYGAKRSTEKHWWKIRAGFDNHADYNDGKNDRVLNSRFATYNFKGSFGSTKRNWVNTNNLFVSSSKFGFVFDSLSRKEKDGRLSRSFDGPHHQVVFGQFSTENTIYKSTSKIKLNGGIISNLRQEDEGGGGISLSMLLNTVSLLAQVTHNLKHGDEWTFGTSSFIQSNTNYGGRIIVPNAVTGEISAYSFYHHRIDKFLIEGGARYDRRFIGTYATGSLNVVGGMSPTQEIMPFNKFYNAFNISAGGGYDFNPSFGFKLNASTGYRPGNLAELSSNGLHEGTLRWEIGKPDAKAEQNLNLEASVHYQTPQWRLASSVYRNLFSNYIYLAPTGTEYFGFAIYRYEQSNATLQGGEFTIDWSPLGSKIEVNAAYSFIDAKKEDESYLPFIPANKLTSEIKFHLASSANIIRPVLSGGVSYAFRQNHPSEFETATSEYLLVNTGFSFDWKKVNFSLAATNLLNKTYYDHLSRFKYYGISNMGRNVVIGLNFKF